MLTLKRLAERLAQDVKERSDDNILLTTAEELSAYIRSMRIKRGDAIEEANEYFEFEGMEYNEDGDEMETLDEVEEKAVKFLQERGFIIDNN